MLLTERLEEDTGSGEGRKCASSWHVLHPALTRACACDDTLTVQSPVFIQSLTMVYHQRGGMEAGSSLLRRTQIRLGGATGKLKPWTLSSQLFW